MAKKRFLVIADSFIGMKLIKAESKEIVEIETDPELGGMRPGSNLVEVDDKGNPVAAKASKAPKRTAASHNDGTGVAGAGGGDANKQGGDAKDLA